MLLNPDEKVRNIQPSQPNKLGQQRINLKKGIFFLGGTRVIKRGNDSAILPARVVFKSAGFRSSPLIGQAI